MRMPKKLSRTAGAVAHSLTSHPRLNNTPGEAGETFECRKRCNGQLHWPEQIMNSVALLVLKIWASHQKRVPVFLRVWWWRRGHLFLLVTSDVDAFKAIANTVQQYLSICTIPIGPRLLESVLFFWMTLVVSNDHLIGPRMAASVIAL